MRRILGFAAIAVSALASLVIADIAVAQNTTEQPVINFSIVRAAAS